VGTTEVKTLGPDGRPLRLPDKALQAPAETTGGARTVVSHVDVETLTPRQIKAMLVAAETGDLSSQAALFERMQEKDGELDAHLRTRRAAVASLPWEILPGEDSAEARRAADYARDVVAGIPALADAIQDLLDAVPMGFAAVEIDWETSEKEWRPARLLYRPQRWFEAAADGVTLRLKKPWGGAEVELNPTNWILHRAKARSGFLGRTSLLRSCVRGFIVRHVSWKDWMAFAEVYGMPMRIGRLREGVPWDSDEAKQLWDAVRALGMDAAAVVREGNEIATVETKGGTGAIFQAILESGSREITLAILGQTLTSGGEKGGSFALGQVHNLVRTDLRNDDATSLAQTLSDQLLAPIVLLNQGQVPLPRWGYAIEEPEDVGLLATTLKTLGEAIPGLKVPRAWLYKKFDIPEPGKGEETVELRPATMGAFSNEDSPRSARRTRRTAQQLITADYSLLTAVPAFRHEARMWRCSPEDFALRLHQDEAWRVLDKNALAFLAEKRVANPATWQALSPAGKQRAWWVTGLDEKQTARVAHDLTRVLEEGETENQFLERLEARGLSVPESLAPEVGQIPAWQARLVHRNNRWTAQNAGQYIRIQQDSDVRPYGQWLCHTPCEVCAPLCGNVAPLNGDFFSTYWPQIHHGCQCEVVSMSDDEIDSEGLRGRLDQADPSPLDAPPDFMYHPGDAFYLQDEGGEPATEAGRSDLALLMKLARVADLL